MPKYLIQASYTVEGTKGLLKARNGGTKRRTAVSVLMKQLGGRVEAFYYAFGDTDVYVIAEATGQRHGGNRVPAITASGAGSLKTTLLLNPEEIDQAAKNTVTYRPPGR